MLAQIGWAGFFTTVAVGVLVTAALAYLIAVARRPLVYLVKSERPATADPAPFTGDLATVPARPAPRVAQEEPLADRRPRPAMR